MKETEKGFYGCFWPLEGSRNCMIAMIGDDCEDYMARSAVKWLKKKFGVSVLTLSPGHKDYSHHNLPIETVGAAIAYGREHGMERFAIVGASTTAMFALAAASFYSDITLTIALSPCDFIMEGFYRGKRDGQEEWPGEGESTLSWEGKPLPYLPFVYRHPEYGEKIKTQARLGKDMAASSWIFNDSEKAHPLQEEEMIRRTGNASQKAFRRSTHFLSANSNSPPSSIFFRMASNSGVPGSKKTFRTPSKSRKT